MRKTKARISPNHENVWDLGREWEMKKDYHGKREWESSGQSFFKGKGKEKVALFWWWPIFLGIEK